MMDVVKFTRTVGIYTKEFTYFSNRTIDASGDYVPLAEYEKLEKLFKTLFLMVNLGIEKGDFDIHPHSEMGLHLAECEKVLE